MFKKKNWYKIPNKPVKALFFILQADFGFGQNPNDDFIGIYSNEPADRQEDAMLSGKGMTGIMVYGHPYNEIIIFNNNKFVQPNGASFTLPDLTGIIDDVRDTIVNNIARGWDMFWQEAKNQGQPNGM